MTSEEKRVVEWLRSSSACAECIWGRDEDCSQHNTPCMIHSAAYLIENTARERDAAVYDLNIAKDCSTCRKLCSEDCHMDYEPCSAYTEGGEYDWRGVCAENGGVEND